MNRDEIHAKLDKLLDGVETLKEKADDKLDELKEKADGKLDALKADGRLDDVRLGAEAAVDQAKRVACRGKNWLREQLTEAQMEMDGVPDKLSRAREEHDQKAAERYTLLMEKYAEKMLAIAQEAADEATDAVQEAVQARRDYQDKFGK